MAPWGLCGAQLWLVACRTDWDHVLVAAQSPCAVHAALTMKMGPRACARVSYLYRPLVIDGDRALHKKRLDVVGVEHDLLELLDRVPP